MFRKLKTIRYGIAALILITTLHMSQALAVPKCDVSTKLKGMVNKAISLFAKKKTIHDDTLERDVIKKLNTRFHRLYNPFGEFDEFGAFSKITFFQAGESGREHIDLSDTTLNRLKLFYEALYYVSLFIKMETELAQGIIPKEVRHEISELYDIDLELLKALVDDSWGNIKLLLNPKLQFQKSVIEILMRPPKQSSENTLILNTHDLVPIEYAISLAMVGFNMQNTRDRDNLRSYLQYWLTDEVIIIRKDLASSIPEKNIPSVIYFSLEVMEACLAAKEYEEEYKAYIADPIRGHPMKPWRNPEWLKLLNAIYDSNK